MDILLSKIYLDINPDSKKIKKLKITNIIKTNKKLVEFNLTKSILSKKNFLDASLKDKEIICVVKVPNNTNNANIAKSLGDKNLVKIGSENNAINKDETLEIK